MTTYVLGKEFFECHKDIEVSTFALWVEKHHAQWYRINKETIKTLSKLQWEELLNYVDKNDWGIEKRKINEKSAFVFRQVNLVDRKSTRLNSSHT